VGKVSITSTERETFSDKGYLAYPSVLILHFILQRHTPSFSPSDSCSSRSQWPRGLRRRSAAERLLGSWVRTPPGAWIFVLYSVCVVR
jgi:hypothetical protein